MPRLVAFLRGINVGGRTAVKEKLQGAFISLGFQSVSTYRQSGNIIFETSATNMVDLKTRIEEELRVTLGYDVTVIIRTILQLKEIIDLKPYEGQDREGASFLVTMLTSMPSEFPLLLPLTVPKSNAQVISAKGLEVFSITHGGGEGGMPNRFLESKLKVKATTRNIRVIEKIVEKYGDKA
jgi:uncharacterized protein (DUF1697 family)